MEPGASSFRVNRIFLPAVPLYNQQLIPRESTFIQYINTLDLHLTKLFTRFEWRCSATTFFDRLSTSRHGQLIVVSDGSAPTDNMSFGWACADDTGRRLARCSGPAFGASSSSQRSEGFGMLAAVVFVYHCLRYFDLHPKWGANFRCDNLALINSCNKYISGNWLMSDTLMADWDLIAPIVHFANKLNVPCSFLHVYGHQDRDIPYEDLPLESQLNCDADALATAYRLDPSPVPECSKPFPGNSVNYSIGGKVISNRYGEFVNLAASAPALVDHMKDRFGWNEFVYSTIDWASHRAFITSQQHRRVQLTKLLQDQLPTAAHLHIASNGQHLAACPRCGFHQETFKHMLQCPHNGNWMASTSRAVTSACLKIQSNQPDVLEAFTRALEMWCFDDTIPLKYFDPCFFSAIQAQSAIGWDQVFRGRFANAWRLANRSASATAVIEDLDLAESDPWICAASRALVDRFFILWETRNQAAHAKKTTHENNIYKVRLRRQIIDLHGFYPATRELDRESIDFVTSDPTDISTIDEFVDNHNRSQLFDWIQLNRPLIIESVRLGSDRDDDQPAIHAFLKGTGRFSTSSSLRRRRRNRQNTARENPDLPLQRPRGSTRTRRQRHQANLLTNYFFHEIRPRHPDVPPNRIRRRDQPPQLDPEPPPRRRPLIQRELADFFP